MLKLNPYVKVIRRHSYLAAQAIAKKKAELAERKKKGETVSTGASKKRRALKKRLSKERAKFYQLLLSK